MLLLAAVWLSSVNDCVRLAKETVIAAVRSTPLPKTKILSTAKPVFVTIEVNGSVRGCRGTLLPQSANLGDEIRRAAEGAAIHDPRYQPLRVSDLLRMAVTVTIVDRLESIPSVAGLRREDGLVLRSGNRTGIVLPWEGFDADTRLQWAYKKAGVAPGSSVQLQRLTGERYRG